MNSISGYKAMWLVAMFDLPVLTKEERREATRFRNMLLKRGFVMLQFSVYGRFCASEEASKIHKKYIRSSLPAEGEVRLVSLTDRQFGKMEIFYGKKAAKPEQPPLQL
ncbi:MAG: CRISPR-associated endonuclease Cas2, partial [Nitrospinae bacterium]|nr:CRISPR-associated endonuclease Cas2 [Nitrospinota bacterium]